jgi:hypothetical protein
VRRRGWPAGGTEPGEGEEANRERRKHNEKDESSGEWIRWTGGGGDEWIPPVSDCEEMI